MDSAKIMLLRTARRKGGAKALLASRNKPRRALVLLLRPVLSRAGAREISRDMEHNSEDAMGTKRSAEIHSGEVKRDRVSSGRAPRQASCFAEYRLLGSIDSSTISILCQQKLFKNIVADKTALVCQLHSAVFNHQVLAFYFFFQNIPVNGFHFDSEFLNEMRQRNACRFA